MSARRLTLPALILLNIGLSGWLAHQWFESNGTTRVMPWVVPAPIAPDLSELEPPSGGASAWDAQRLARLQERPLFSPSRRPPPPPAPVAPPPPPDPLEQAHVYGVFVQEDGGGGVILRVDGKVSRVAVGGRVGPWTIKSVTDLGVQLQRGAETRTLQIKRVAGVKTPPATASSRASAGQGRSAPNARGAVPPVPPGGAGADGDTPTLSTGAPAAPSVAPAPASATTLEERRAERRRLLDERRAAGGLAPLPQ